jgi:hypothetical protein
MQEASMEQETSHTRYDEFAEQFTSVMYEHWSDILLIVNRQSSRVASLLRLATPASLKRMNGVWYIQVITKPTMQHDKLRHPRDNEIVAQAIRLYYHRTAELKLPRIIIEFEV